MFRHRRVNSPTRFFSWLLFCGIGSFPFCRPHGNCSGDEGAFQVRRRKPLLGGALFPPFRSVGGVALPYLVYPHTDLNEWRLSNARLPVITLPRSHHTYLSSYRFATLSPQEVGRVRLRAKPHSIKASHTKCMCRTRHHAAHHNSCAKRRHANCCYQLRPETPRLSLVSGAARSQRARVSGCCKLIAWI